ncbi:hypothetical protein Btru_051173 [Bulinus truncatus]|nr:hypothetical protein Btru_051173 [Bulinus truncatus]
MCIRPPAYIPSIIQVTGVDPPCRLCYTYKNVTTPKSSVLFNQSCVYRTMQQECHSSPLYRADLNDTGVVTLYCEDSPLSSLPVGFPDIFKQCSTSYVTPTTSSAVSSNQTDSDLVHGMIGLGAVLAAVFIIVFILFIKVCRFGKVKKSQSSQSVKFNSQERADDDLGKSTGVECNGKERISYNLPENEEDVYYRIDDARVGIDHNISNIYTKTTHSLRGHSNEYSTTLGTTANDVMTSSDSDQSVSQTPSSQERDAQNEAKETYFVLKNEIESRDATVQGGIADVNVRYGLLSNDSTGYSKLGENRRMYDHDYGTTGIDNEAASMENTKSEVEGTDTNTRLTVLAEKISTDDMHGLHNGSKYSDMLGLHNGSQDSDMHGLHNGSNDCDMHGLHNGSQDSDMHGLHNGSKYSDMHGLHNGSQDSYMHGLHNGSNDCDMRGLHHGSNDSDMHGLHNGSNGSDIHGLHNGSNDSDIHGLHNGSNDSDMHGLHNGSKDSDMHGLHNG